VAKVEYPVRIEERLVMVVYAEAGGPEEAERLVKSRWENEEILLDEEDFAGVTFTALE